MLNRAIQRRFWQVSSVLLLMALAGSAIADTRVTMTQARDANGVKYTYAVISGSSERIVAVHIGFDYLHGVPELQVPPTGWTIDSGIANGTIASPGGWTPAVVTTEESPLLDIEWTSDSSGAFDIAPLASLSGFAVRVPAPSDEYASASFDVVLGSGAHVYGRVEPASGKRRAVSH